MKRLTEYTIPETGFSVVSEEKYKRILMEEKPSVEKVYNRLKKIEDILGDEYDLDELREMAQAKREGRCVVLPCKIFDKIWNVAAHYQFEVTEIDLLPYGNILFRCGNKGTDDYAAFYGDDLGDTFTFEEPQERDNCVVKEAALRREQE